jgi:hypothetical protein
MEFQINGRSILVKNQVTVTKSKSLINDIVRINVLEEEIEYYKSLLQPHDTGHIHTAISFVENRIRILKGGKKEWPFDS